MFSKAQAAMMIDVSDDDPSPDAIVLSDSDEELPGGTATCSKVIQAISVRYSCLNSADKVPCSDSCFYA